MKYNNGPQPKYVFKEPQRRKSGVGLSLLIVVIVLAVIGGGVWAVVHFGSGDAVEKVVPPPPVPVAETLPPPPKPGKYRQIPENPKFAAPLEYDQCVHGTIPGLPGSQNARVGMLVDLNSRKVLWEKNSNDGVPIASMVKMMTLLLTFEAMEVRPDLTLETVIPVSAACSKIGGTQVFLDPKESFPIGELLKSVVIRSANDSAYLLAEYLSGENVPAFVAQMNQRASELGMVNTKYVNPNGLPADDKTDSVASALGQVLLAEQLLQYPKVLEWSSTRRAPFREPGSKGWQDMTNTNKLLGVCPGVDGMKTGFIQKSGFCLTATCLRGGKRMVAVVTGFSSGKERDAFVKQLLDWGYRTAAEKAL